MNMKIKKVEIKNFRSIIQGSFEIENILAIVGQNNSGKSNILCALDSFFHPDKQLENYLNNKNSCGIPRKNPCIEITFSEVPHEFDTFKNSENNIKIKQSFSNNRLIYNIFNPTDGKYEIFDKNIKNYIDFVLIPIDRVSDVDGDKLPENSIVYKAIKNSLLKLSERRDTYSVQLQKAYEYIDKHAFEKIAKDINNYYVASHVSAKIMKADNVDSTLLMSVLGISISEKGKEYPINLCGSGIQSLFVIGIYHYISSQIGVNYLIAIEEPEVNLHPQAQRQFANSLLNNTSNNQVILSTHSPSIVDQLGHKDMLLVKKISHPKKGFESKLTQLSSDFFERNGLDVLAYYKFAGFKNSDFFFSSHLIITESPTDGNVVKLLGEKYNIDLLNYGISFVSLGGVCNFKYLYFLLKELDIPHTWIFDKDYFLDYKNSKKENSRDSSGFFQYSNNWTNDTTKKESIKKLFYDDSDRDKILKFLTSNHQKALTLMSRYNVICMRYNLEMDICSSKKSLELYYDLLHIPPRERNVKKILVDNKNAIKDATYIHKIIESLENRNLPYSFKEIVKQLKKIINESV